MADVPHRVSWRALLAMYRYAPKGSAVQRVVAETAAWDTRTELSALTVDLLTILAWQQTADGQSKHPKNQPKPLPRPWHIDHPSNAPRLAGEAGLADQAGLTSGPESRFGDAAMTLDDTRKWLGW